MDDDCCCCCRYRRWGHPRRRSCRADHSLRGSCALRRSGRIWLEDESGVYQYKDGNAQTKGCKLGGEIEGGGEQAKIRDVVFMLEWCVGGTTTRWRRRRRRRRFRRISLASRNGRRRVYKKTLRWGYIYKYITASVLYTSLLCAGIYYYYYYYFTTRYYIKYASVVLLCVYVCVYYSSFPPRKTLLLCCAGLYIQISHANKTHQTHVFIRVFVPFSSPPPG